MTRVVALLMACIALASCSTTMESISEKVIDSTPAWMGGLPKDAPPRLGTPEYDEFGGSRKLNSPATRAMTQNPNTARMKMPPQKYSTQSITPAPRTITSIRRTATRSRERGAARVIRAALFSERFNCALTMNPLSSSPAGSHSKRGQWNNFSFHTRPKLEQRNSPDIV